MERSSGSRRSWPNKREPGSRPVTARMHILWLLVSVWSAIYKPVGEIVQALSFLLVPILVISEVMDASRFPEPLLARVQARVDLQLSAQIHQRD